MNKKKTDKHKTKQENIVIWIGKSFVEWLINQPRVARFSMLVFVVVAVYFGIFEWRAKQREDSSGPVITMEEDTITVSVSDDESALLQGITATDRKDGDVTDSIVVESLSSFISDARRTVTYAAFDSDDHVTRKSRSVVYKDYTKPEFRLTHPLQFPTNTKELLSGLTIKDSIDGDITSSVKFLPQGEFSVETPGTYQVEFRAINSAGDVIIMNAPLVIYDPGSPRGPQITLTDYLVYLEKDSDFHPENYLDTIKLNREYDIVPGEGNYDMDPQPKDERIVVGTNHIEIENKVNMGAPGTYTVTYSRTVDAGNQEMVTGSVQLIVVVRDKN